MSLKTLLLHKMTIQTAESAANASDGTLDRESAWTNTSFVNIACNIQEKTSVAVDSRFNKLDTYDDNQTMLRVLVWRTDPTLAISFPVSESNKKHIDIYEFLGHIEQVKSRRRLARRLFHLRVEKSHKWIYS